jgi:hypothetical protein
MGLALPDWGNPILGRRRSVRAMLWGGAGAVVGMAGKYECRPAAGGVGRDWCDKADSEGLVLAVRNGDWCASMVPVGGFSKFKLWVLCSRGDFVSSMCLAPGLPGGWNGRGICSSCVSSALFGRLIEGRLCECEVSTGEGESICEALLLLLRSCSLSSCWGLRIWRKGSAYR